MSKLTINLVARSYDLLMPLACGDVEIEGADADIEAVAADIQAVELNLDRQTDMKEFLVDQSFHAGEMSFSQYLIRMALGDREFVGLPIFLMRGFRHRCFYVLSGSGLTSFGHLAGKRVGTNGWVDTGNTWSRAALREQGVNIGQIEWWVGPVDDPAYDSFGKRPAVKLPANVRPVAAGRTLQEMLLGKELDALMCPWPPKRFSEPASPIVRLYHNYQEVEQDYAQCIGFYPGFHILAIRRPVLERHPWLARTLFEAFERSRLQAGANRRWLADTSPWYLADLEVTEQVLGADWQAHGIEPNQRMIQALCEEEYAQGLIPEPLDHKAVFQEFAEMMGGDRYA